MNNLFSHFSSIYMIGGNVSGIIINILYNHPRRVSVADVYVGVDPTPTSHAT